MFPQIPLNCLLLTLFLALFVVLARMAWRLRHTARDLRHRVTMENLLASISSRLVCLPADELDQTLCWALQQIGQFVQVDRTYIFLLRPDGLVVDNTHEWCAPDIEPQQEHLQGLPLEQFPWWQQQLRQLENITLSSLDDLPPEAENEREILQAQDIQSILVVPLHTQGEYLGFVGFDAVRRPCFWQPQDVTLLRLLSQLLAHALQRHRTEQILYDSEERYRQLAEESPVPLIVHHQGKLLYFNRAGSALFGAEDNKDLLGHPLVDFLPDRGSSSLFCLAPPPNKPPPFCEEGSFLRPDGSQIFLESKSTPITYQGLPATQVVLHDITQRKENEATLRQAMEEAEAANRAKSTFLANMNHELRTPLTSILGYTDLLLEESSQNGSTDFVSNLERIRVAGRHLLSLICDLLDLSKIEAGRMEIHPETVDVTELLTDIITTILPLLEENNNQIQIDVSEELGEMQTDPTKVRQIMVNLLSNAAKFTEEGTITFTVLRDPGDPDWLHFYVSDTGPGLSLQQRQTLFQPFVQHKQSSPRSKSGTGLGLAISQQLCKLMGGYITVESRTGQGSTFTAHLPTRLPSPLPPSSPTLSSSPPTPHPR